MTKANSLQIKGRKNKRTILCSNAYGQTVVKTITNREAKLIDRVQKKIDKVNDEVSCIIEREMDRVAKKFHERFPKRTLEFVDYYSIGWRIDGVDMWDRDKRTYKLFKMLSDFTSIYCELEYKVSGTVNKKYNAVGKK